MITPVFSIAALGLTSGRLVHSDGSSLLSAPALAYAASGTHLTLTAQAATDVPVKVKGATSQSANLQEWQNSSGTALASVSSAGAVDCASLTIQSATGSGASISLPFGAYACLAINFAGGPLWLYGGTGILMRTAVGIGTSGEIAANAVPLTVSGVASQTAPLLAGQLISSTAARRDAFDLTAAWADSTDATRKARLTANVYDTAARECLRLEADGSYGLVSVGGAAVTASTALSVVSPAAAYKGLVVKGATSQSANLQEWQNSAGTAKAWVDSSGGAEFTNELMCIDGSATRRHRVSCNTNCTDMMTTWQVRWADTSDAFYGTKDVGLARNAAGQIRVTDGSTGYGELTCGTVTLNDAANLVVGTTTGTKIGTATGQKLAFWNATPVVQQVLATGAGATVDDVITLLQTLGLCRQS